MTPAFGRVPNGYAPGMFCPLCGSADTKVVDSRPADQGASIRRRRECLSCHSRFTTYERAEAVLLVRKRDGAIEPFQTEKVRRGLERALTDRPVAAEAVAGMDAARNGFSQRQHRIDFGGELDQLVRSSNEIFCIGGHAEGGDNVAFGEAGYLLTDL